MGLLPRSLLFEWGSLLSAFSAAALPRFTGRPDLLSHLKWPWDLGPPRHVGGRSHQRTAKRKPRNASEWI
jgi:hypothetical protein